MIGANKPLLSWSTGDAAQASLEISYSHLWRVLAHLRGIFVCGGYSILYYQYRFNDGAGAFRAYCCAGVGVSK